MSLNDFVLALDQGTTSSRAILFDQEGLAQASAQQVLPQIFPGPGLVEHDAMQIWRDTLATARGAMEQAGIGAKRIAGIGVTNQRETTVIWRRDTGQPIHNAIVWQDRRTADLCENLRRAGHDELIRERTGLIFPPPRSPGCWKTWRAPVVRRRPANWHSAPSIAGCCGT